MKKFLIPILFLAAFTSFGQTKKVAVAPKTTTTSTVSISDKNGALKDALNQGIDKGVSLLSASGGFFNNPSYKILLPDEAKKMEEKLRSMGMGGEIDKAIKAMNEAAEKATNSAKPIFAEAVKNLSFQDANAIITGGDGAATNYLRKSSTDNLKTTYRPKIKEALDATQATKYYQVLVDKYNKIPFVTKVNSDLTEYVTGKATEALFKQIEIEENNIRKNPVARTTDLLKKAFTPAK